LSETDVAELKKAYATTARASLKER
jgi:hypothetical protein